MAKKEKTEIIILIILLIILIISIWIGLDTKSNNSITKNSCIGMCRNGGDEEWMFRGQVFYSLEDCIAKCQATANQ